MTTTHRPGFTTTAHEDIGDRAFIVCAECGLALDDIGPAGTVEYRPEDVRPAPAGLFAPGYFDDAPHVEVEDA
jgi:hypothetical protein